MQPPTAFPGPTAVDSGNPRLIVLGDTQRTSRLEFLWRPNDAAQTALLAEVAKRRPAAVINLGDLVTWGPSKSQWRHFDAVHAPLAAAHIPYLPVLGNHDYMPRLPRDLAPYKARFQALGGTRWYAATWRGIAFVLLDSNFKRLGRAAIAAQRAWYEQTLAELDADPTVDAIVACWHHAPFTNSRIVRPSRRARRELLAPLAAAPKGRAVFTGHCHAYEHFVEDGLHCIVTGGAGGPLQPLRRRRPRTPDRFSWPSARRFLHVCELTTTPAELNVAVVRLDDTGRPAIADRVAIPRTPPALTASVVAPERPTG